MKTPAKTLALKEAGALGGRLNEVDSKALVHTLADTILEVEADSLGAKIADAEDKTQVV